MGLKVTALPPRIDAKPLSPCPERGRMAETAQSHTAPDLTDPQSPAILEALTRRCDQCRAPAGQLCVQRGGYRADLTGRLIHLGRMQPP